MKDFVTSGNNFHVCQAVFFPRPINIESVASCKSEPQWKRSARFLLKQFSIIVDWKIPKFGIDQ